MPARTYARVVRPEPVVVRVKLAPEERRVKPPFSADEVGLLVGAYWHLTFCRVTDRQPVFANLSVRGRPLPRRTRTAQ